MLKVLSNISHSGSKLEVGQEVDESMFTDKELEQLMGSKAVEKIAEKQVSKSEQKRQEELKKSADDSEDKTDAGADLKKAAPSESGVTDSTVDDTPAKPAVTWSKPRLQEYCTNNGIEFVEEDNRTDLYNKIKASGK